MVYFVGEPFVPVNADYFSINPTLNNFPFHGFTNFGVQSYDTQTSSFVNKIPFFIMPSLAEGNIRIYAQEATT